MKRILVSNIMMLKEKERFREELIRRGYIPIFPIVNQFLSESEAIQLVGEVDGWLAGDDQITRKVLKAASPQLKVISKWGTGTDSIDKIAASEFGIPVLNTPGAFRDAVSEVAIGFMLDLARNISHIDRLVRSGQWPKIQASGLVGKDLCLIGYGAIGKGVAERAIAMKMNVFAYDPNFTNESHLSEVKNIELDEAFSRADYLCLACNYSKQNHHLVDSKRLKQMKKGAFLVNVARGPLVDESSLVEALLVNEISGAGLDVYENEPLPLESKLFDFDNVVLGSHNSNNMFSATEFVHKNTLYNLDLILKPT